MPDPRIGHIVAQGSTKGDAVMIAGSLVHMYPPRVPDVPNRKITVVNLSYAMQPGEEYRVNNIFPCEGTLARTG